MQNLNPLHKAVIQGEINLIATLLAQGESIYTCDGDNDTPLSLAIKSEQKKVIRFLFENKFIKINDTPPGEGHPHAGITPAWLLAWSHQWVLLQELNELLNTEPLNLDAAPEAEDYPEESITLQLLFNEELADALCTGDIKTAMFLINNGADIHFVTNEQEWTMLHCAAMNSASFELIPFFLKEAVDKNAKDCDDKTAYHYILECYMSEDDQKNQEIAADAIRLLKKDEMLCLLYEAKKLEEGEKRIVLIKKKVNMYNQCLAEIKNKTEKADIPNNKIAKKIHELKVPSVEEILAPLESSLKKLQQQMEIMHSCDIENSGFEELELLKKNIAKFLESLSDMPQCFENKLTALEKDFQSYQNWAARRIEVSSNKSDQTLYKSKKNPPDNRRSKQPQVKLSSSKDKKNKEEKIKLQTVKPSVIPKKTIESKTKEKLPGKGCGVVLSETYINTELQLEPKEITLPQKSLPQIQVIVYRNSINSAPCLQPIPSIETSSSFFKPSCRKDPESQGMEFEGHLKSPWDLKDNYFEPEISDDITKSALAYFIIGKFNLPKIKQDVPPKLVPTENKNIRSIGSGIFLTAESNSHLVPTKQNSSIQMQMNAQRNNSDSVANVGTTFFERTQNTVMDSYLQISALMDLKCQDFSTPISVNIYKLALTYFVIRTFNALLEMSKEEKDKVNYLIKNFGDLRNQLVKCALKPDMDINTFYWFCCTIKQGFEEIYQHYTNFHTISEEELIMFCQKIKESDFTIELRRKWESYQTILHNQNSTKENLEAVLPYLMKINQILKDVSEIRAKPDFSEENAAIAETMMEDATQMYVGFIQNSEFLKNSIKENVENLKTYLIQISDILKVVDNVLDFRNQPDRVAATKALIVEASQIFVDFIQNSELLQRIKSEDINILNRFFWKLRQIRNPSVHDAEKFREVDENEILKLKYRIKDILPILEKLNAALFLDEVPRIPSFGFG